MAKATKAAKPVKEKPAVVKKDKIIHLNFFSLGITNSIDVKDRQKVSDSFKVSPDKFDILDREDDSRISIWNDKLFTKDGLTYGTLIHTQTKDLPFTSDDSSKKYEALKLTDEQGLGYTTSFLFDPEVNILMIESVRNGIGIGTFCEFFEKNLELENLNASVVIEPGEKDKLSDFKSISKLHYKIARLQSGSPLKGQKNVVGSLIKAADETNIDTMEIVMSAGRKKNASLARDIVNGIINSILQYTSKDKKDVKKLFVTGKGSMSGHTDEIDLIKHRIKSEIVVDLVRTNTLVTMTERYTALNTAYMTHKIKIHAAYK